MKIIRFRVIASNGMNIHRDSTKLRARDKEIQRAMELEKDYTLLKHLNEMLGKPIKFDDFDSIAFSKYASNKSITFKSPKLKIFKVLKVSDLHEKFKLWPEMFADFLKVNGAVETDNNGVPMQAIQKQYMGLHRPFTPVIDNKQKRWELVNGFWKEIDETPATKH